MTMTYRSAALGAAMLLAASAFAAGAWAQDAAAPAETPAAEAPAAEAPTAPAAATPVELGKPAPGKGQVVFFRQSKLMGAALSFKVREGEAELGKLSNGVYFAIDFTPGLHEFVVHSETKDVTPIEVEEGEVYYLQFGISVGVLAGRPNLTPSSKEAFDAIAGKMKPSKWSPDAK